MEWLKAAIFGLLLLGIYYSALSWLITKDWARGDYSYCYFIPPIVLYLIWEKRAELIKLPSTPAWKGILILCAGIILFWLGELGGEYFTLYFSFWVAVFGVFLLELGWKKVKVILFPIFFILAMFPVPHFLNTKISLKLKLISSQLGMAMMRLIGISAYREGNVIDLGFTQLQVVDACSGLR